MTILNDFRVIFLSLFLVVVSCNNYEKLLQVLQGDTTKIRVSFHVRKNVGDNRKLETRSVFVNNENDFRSLNSIISDQKKDISTCFSDGYLEYFLKDGKVIKSFFKMRCNEISFKKGINKYHFDMDETGINTLYKYRELIVKEVGNTYNVFGEKYDNIK